MEVLFVMTDGGTVDRKKFGQKMKISENFNRLKNSQSNFDFVMTTKIYNISMNWVDRYCYDMGDWVVSKYGQPFYIKYIIQGSPDVLERLHSKMR